MSALNVSVYARVLLLLQELQAEFGLTYILISHSLHVMTQVADRVAILRAGKFAECGPFEQVLHGPQQRYTRELLALHFSLRVSHDIFLAIPRNQR